MKKIILILCIGLYCLVDVSAQQYPMYTNFLMNRWSYNPAVGVANGCINANLLYRKQWVGLSNAPETGAVGLRVGFGNLTLGGTLLQDRAGLLEFNVLSPQAAYRIHYGSKGYVSIGASLSITNMVLSPNVTAADDLDPLSSLSGTIRQKPDMNFGFVLHHGGFEFSASSPYFLNRRIVLSDTSFGGDYLHHYFVSATYRYNLTQKVELEPAAFSRIVENAPPQFELGGRVYIDKIWVGAMARIGDAFSIGAGLRLPRLNFGYSYDVTTSTLRKASSGSHEIGLAYRLCRKKKEDKDKDGIPDKDDPCPDFVGTPDNPCPKDTDKDGLYDHEDDCPLAAGPVENKGCPEKDEPEPEPEPIAIGPDADGDGIPDSEDDCPNTKGGDNGVGCPEPSVAELNILEYAIRNLYFDTDKAIIRSEAFWHLDRLAKLLVEKRDWKVRITGHTDARQTDDYNLKLSARRAKAAYDYLVKRGVHDLQLIIGYEGEKKPAADNVTEVGMQRNRRVELEFVFD